MSNDFHRRDYGAFLSYSEHDGKFARSVGTWLDRYAGLKVWRGEKDAAGKGFAATDLPEAIGKIGKSRSYLLLVTKASVGADWVRQEWEIVNEEASRERLFRKLLLVSSDVRKEEIPLELRSTARIDLPADEILGDVAAATLLSSFYVSDESATSYDVYVTRSWTDGERVSNFTDGACAELAKQFRLIGDSPRNDYDAERIRSVMASCGAYVAFLPPREPERLQYMLPEVVIARSCGLPVLLFADKIVLSHPPEFLRTCDDEKVTLEGAIPVDMKGEGLGDEILKLLRRESGYLKERYRSPENPYTVFFASEPKWISDRARDSINRIVSGVTGRKCVFPDDIEVSAGEKVQQRLTAAISTAVAVIADVTSATVDTWIHAGIARGASRPLTLLTRDRETSPPFSFNDMKPTPYQTEVERLGLVHRIVYHHRRRFMNVEVAR